MLVLWRERQFSQAESWGMPFPEQIKGVLLAEGASLTQQREQNLRVLAGGRVDVGHLSLALRSMDTTLQKLTETRAQRTFYRSDCETRPENNEESRDECLLDSEEEQAIIEEVDALDLESLSSCWPNCSLKERRKLSLKTRICSDSFARIESET